MTDTTIVLAIEIGLRAYAAADVVAAYIFDGSAFGVVCVGADLGVGALLVTFTDVIFGADLEIRFVAIATIPTVHTEILIQQAILLAFTIAVAFAAGDAEIG